MAVQLIKGVDDDLRPDDVVVRQRAEARARQHEVAEYRKVIQPAEFGDRTKPVVLRFVPGAPYLFACYSDNPDWQKFTRDAWHTTAMDALERYCAQHDLQTLDQAREEITNRYNYFVEVRGKLE